MPRSRRQVVGCPYLAASVVDRRDGIKSQDDASDCRFRNRDDSRVDGERLSVRDARVRLHDRLATRRGLRMRSKAVMTKTERAAMESINKHFTFREKTAFLVGYRLAKRKAMEVAQASQATDNWNTVKNVSDQIGVRL